MNLLQQSGAIPFRRRGEELEFLLVTSKGGKWIFPKGIVEPGETPAETAAKECREEAGIFGQIVPDPIASYRVRKWKRDCEVALFLLRYEHDVHPWEEEGLRERRWCDQETAAALLGRSELVAAIERAARVLEREPDLLGP
jgi:phosphohistidine phosphatase